MSVGWLLAGPLLLPAFGCDRTMDDPPPRVASPERYSPEGENAPTPAEVSGSARPVEEVAEHARAFIGQTVTVYGEVEDVRNDRAFDLERDDRIFGAKIHVITRSPLRVEGDALEHDDEILVSGVIREMIVADIEREVGWDLDPELEVEWRSEPVLIASSIRRVRLDENDMLRDVR
jgi:hypothetical protein